MQNSSKPLMPRKNRFQSRFKEEYEKNLAIFETTRQKVVGRLNAMAPEMVEVQQKYIRELENRVKHLEAANESLRKKLSRG